MKSSRRRFLGAQLPSSLLLGGCAGLWRASPPATAEALSVRLPAIAAETLAGGASLLACALPGLATAEVGVSLSLGAADDPPGRAGLGRVALEALVQGQLRDEFAGMGAELETLWADDGSAVEAVVEAADAPAALARLALRLRQRDFGDEDLEAALASSLAQAELRESDDRLTALRALRRAIFPAAHPYVRAGLPTAASLRTVTREEVERYLTEQLRPGRLGFVAAGAGAGPEARTALLAVLGDMQGAGGEPPPVAAPTPARREAVIVIPWPGSDQCVLAAGRVGLAASHPEALHLDVLAAILGSRLHERLRGDRALTYGVHVEHDETRYRGALTLTTQVEVSALKTALRLVLEQIEASGSSTIRQGWLPERADSELLARALLRQSAQGRFHEAARLHRLGLDLAHDERRFEALRKLDAGALLRTFAPHCDPSLWSIVVVGDPARVEPLLAAAGHRVVLQTRESLAAE